jgi:hypothetical protein
MKIHLLTLAALLFLWVGSASAQNINIGTKIGLNSYTINSGNNSGVDSRIGIHAGLLGHIHLNHQFALQPEIMYSMQGAKLGNTTIELDYINVPLLVQYMFNNGFRMQAGPQVGVLINSRARNNVSVNISDSYKPVDVGLSFGVGFIHSATSLGIDLRYNLGLTDISKTSAVESTNRGLQVGIFYLFDHH